MHELDKILDDILTLQEDNLEKVMDELYDFVKKI